jgi:hypothetical protein
MIGLCQPSMDGLVGQVVNLSLDRIPSCPTYQTNIDGAIGLALDGQRASEWSKFHPHKAVKYADFSDAGNAGCEKRCGLRGLRGLRKPRYRHPLYYSGSKSVLLLRMGQKPST